MKNYEKLTKAELIRLLKKSDEASAHGSGAVAAVREGGDADVPMNGMLACESELAEQNRELEEIRHLLEESLDRYADLFDFAPVGYVTLDHCGIIREINLTAASMLGAERRSLVGMLLPARMSKPSASLLREALQHCRKSGMELSIEVEFPAGEGKLFHAQLVGTAMADYASREISYRLAIIDISDRRKAEEEIRALNAYLEVKSTELEASNRELDTFSHTISHDLRAPLTNISGCSQAVLEVYGESLDEQCRDFIRIIYQEAMRMDRLISSLLNFARMKGGELKREEVDLSSMARAIEVELRLRDTQRRATFIIADGLKVMGDANLLRVALHNLFTNAWKFTGRKDEAVIEFGTTEVDGELAFFVRDNGVGFSMEHAGRLFTAFQRIPGSEEYPGIGIGLATVQRIVQRHGGRTWAKGEPGKGATFYFTL